MAINDEKDNVATQYLSTFVQLIEQPNGRGNIN